MATLTRTFSARERQAVFDVWQATGTPERLVAHGDLERVGTVRELDGTCWMRSAAGAYVEIAPDGPRFVEGAAAQTLDQTLWWGWPADRLAHLTRVASPGSLLTDALVALGVPPDLAPATPGRPDKSDRRGLDRPGQVDLWATLTPKAGWRVHAWPEQRGRITLDVDPAGVVQAAAVHTGAEALSQPPAPLVSATLTRVDTPAEAVLRAALAGGDSLHLVARRWKPPRWPGTWTATITSADRAIEALPSQPWSWSLADLGHAPSLDTAELVQLATAVVRGQLAAAPQAPRSLGTALAHLALARMGNHDHAAPEASWTASSQLFAAMFPERMTRAYLSSLLDD